MIQAHLAPALDAVLAGCVAAVLIFAAPAGAQLRLPALLGDNAVLQRAMRVPIWGYGSPGMTVTVVLAGQSRSAVVGPDGLWRVHLAPIAAGGPYDMTVSAGGERLVSKNLLVGDIWVASGQSNMVWPLNQSRDGAEATRTATYPHIRLFSVPREAATTPQADCRGHWEVCSPQTVGNFSGVAFFFGRELHSRLKVPIGLIQSDVGGTPAESWTDAEWLKGEPAFRNLLDKVPAGGASARLGHAEYEKTMNDWYVSVMMQDPGNAGVGDGWAGPSPPGEWTAMRLPGAWEANQPALNIDGAVWYRREVEIPSSWAGKELSLRLGAIADRDVTYFDGVEVGAMGGQYPDASLMRTYAIPGRLVRSGTATIAVRVFNMIAAGGFTGQPEDMRLDAAGVDGHSIPLSGEWRFRVEHSRDAADVAPMPPPPADAWTAWSTGGLYNAMVAPITRHAIKGVIWYQGESNVGRAEQYRKLFPPLVRGWRRVWAQGDLPFLFVQLANFMPRRPEPADSDWAELREAQTAALKLPKTAMAVAIDLGEAADIHPKNKRDVGLRLALAARSVAYGEAGVGHTGPVLRDITAKRAKLTLRFDHVGEGLKTADGGPVRGFAVAGADGTFVWADATIAGSTVVVSSPLVAAPVAVRYAWADNPDCNLTDSAGLPAAPFRAQVRRAPLQRAGNSPR